MSVLERYQWLLLSGIIFKKFISRAISLHFVIHLLFSIKKNHCNRFVKRKYASLNNMLQIRKNRYPSFQLVYVTIKMNETYNLLVARVTVENIEFRHRGS